jgi:hypothetical protein
MEVDSSKQIQDWATIRLDERKALAEELSCEGLIVFWDYSITLYHASY